MTCINLLATVLGVKGSQVQILSSDGRSGRFPSRRKPSVSYAYRGLSMSVDMVEELPDRFRSASGALVTPWNSDGGDDDVPVGAPR
jgi:hypothetical protein